MSRLYFTSLSSPFGDLLAARTDQGLSHLLLPSSRNRSGTPPVLQISNWRDRFAPGLLLTEAPQRFGDIRRWLDAYFQAKVPKEQILLDLKGTAFQQAVWDVICSIPYGHTLTYGEIGRRIGRSPGSSRAVGSATGANPVWIVVPCHRVIGGRGGLTGYGGGLKMKEQLLRLEGNLLL
jgi:O-6-methylguanine DNA methyltransferase